jgi:hypothetical protein
MNTYVFTENDVTGYPTGRRITQSADNFLEAFRLVTEQVEGKLTKQKYMIVCPDKTYWIGNRCL